MNRVLSLRHLVVAVGVLLGSQVAAMCSGMALNGCSFFGNAVDANDPHDDSKMFDCRLEARTQFGFDKDAGSAWQLYDDCMKDAGYR